jgi:hypothetical protein
MSSFARLSKGIGTKASIVQGEEKRRERQKNRAFVGQQCKVKWKIILRVNARIHPYIYTNILHTIRLWLLLLPNIVHTNTQILQYIHTYLKWIQFQGGRTLPVHK